MFMATSKYSMIREVTEEYLKQMLSSGVTPQPEEIADEILEQEQMKFEAINAVKPKGAKLRIPDSLIPQQIADILVRLHPISVIELSEDVKDADNKIVAIYQEDGPNQGLYVEDDEIFIKLMKLYQYGLNKRDIEEVFACLKTTAPKRQLCKDVNLIAVNNGIFDYETKILRAFTPDVVFLSKSRVNYNPLATNIVLHNPDDGTDWDVESWMSDLSDDPEIVQLLWQILGAIVRPNVHWDKAAWFYSETGNNGKGTLCELMRSLTGQGTYASIPLSDFGKDFALTKLVNASAIIVDENDVGTYIDKAANLKAVVTGDVVQINRKFRDPISFRFHGFMVQCLNEMPRVRDKSDSFFRRQVFIPFTKCFTGAERKYIKHDYLHRPEVLEYVLHKVLNMDYVELDVPESCLNALAEYKEFNDPLRQFTSEILPELQWDLVPFTFLYDLYKMWYKKNVGNGEVISRKMFVKNLVNVLNDDSEFICEDKSKKYYTGSQMDKAEPLIAEYDLKDWMNPHAAGSHDMEKRCHPILQANYRGLLRRVK